MHFPGLLAAFLTDTFTRTPLTELLTRFLQEQMLGSAFLIN